MMIVIVFVFEIGESQVDFGFVRLISDLMIDLTMRDLPNDLFVCVVTLPRSGSDLFVFTLPRSDRLVPVMVMHCCLK